MADQARRRGIAPEAFALDVLRRHLTPVAPPTPTDDWERRLFGAAIDCGVSVPDAALSSASNESDVPFDVRHIRVIYYDKDDPFWGDKLMKKITENILSAINNPEEAIFKSGSIQ